MNRRGFLAGMLAIGAAPAIITSKGVLGALIAPEQRIFVACDPSSPVLTPQLTMQELEAMVRYAFAHAIIPDANGDYWAMVPRLQMKAWAESLYQAGPWPRRNPGEHSVQSAENYFGAPADRADHRPQNVVPARAIRARARA